MNPSDQRNQELLTAYFDGELSPAEQREVEQLLFTRPELRRRIAEWQVLRQACQTAFQGAFQGSYPGEQRQLSAVKRDASAIEKAVMDRISQALATGQVAWAAGVHPAERESTDERAMAERQAMVSSESGGQPSSGRRLVESVQDQSASGEPVSPQMDTVKRRDSANWLADFRTLNPRQRLRRWGWQLTAVGAVAAALVLTVVLGPLGGPVGPRMASDPPAESNSMAASATMDREAGFYRGETTGAGDLAVASRWNHSPEPAAGTAADEPLDLLGNLQAAGDLPEFFVVYDVADQRASWQQINSLVMSNDLASIEAFEEGGSPAVVLSGEVKKLSDMLSAFQSSGDHSLALISRVSSGPAVLDQPAMLSQGELAARALDHPESLSRGAAVAEHHHIDPRLDPRTGLDRELPQLKSGEHPLPGVDNALAMAALPAAGAEGVSESPPNQGLVQGLPDAANELRSGPPVVASFNHYRQDIIRSQATVLGNSLTQRPDVTLESFINQHPVRPRARIPYAGTESREQRLAAAAPASDSEADGGTSSSDGLMAQMDSKNKDPRFGSVAGGRIENQPALGGLGPAQVARSQPQSGSRAAVAPREPRTENPTSPMAKQFGQSAVGEPVQQGQSPGETAESEQVQIVVILRAKSNFVEDPPK